MKKFIFTIIIFGIGLLGLASIADFVISANLRKSKARMLIGWNDIYSSNICSDVVIMGNSRAWVQYSPQILDSVLSVNAYNLGVDGAPMKRQILKYNTYRRFNTKPKLIIQNIDFKTMIGFTGYEREQFFPYFFDDSIKKAVAKDEKINFMERYLPVYRYIGYNDLILAGLEVKEYWDKAIIEKGYFGMNKTWEGTKIPETITYFQDSLALLFFDKYLEKSQSEGIQVLFVHAPIYIAATEIIDNIEGMYQMYDSIACKYGIPILDYTHFPINNDTTYFYNATHLNKRGAEHFTKQLAHDIDSLGILR